MNEFCTICSGTGWRPAKGEGRETQVERCDCVRVASLAGRLRQIPMPYRDVTVEGLQPSKLSFTPMVRQQEIIEAIKSKPRESYFLTGPTGGGKTHLLWSLYRYAIEHAASCVYVAHMPALAIEWRDWNIGTTERRPTVVRGDILRDGERGRVPHVYLDEVDKATSSDFVRAQLHGLIDSLTLCPRAQLVLASNMSREEFAAAWGGDVLRRIESLCTTVNYFGVREQEVVGA